MKRITLYVIMAIASFSSSAIAGDLNLTIHHKITSLSADGVSRQIEFGERLYRRDNQVWNERIIPAGAHSDAEHTDQHNEEHKHLDLAASARWIVRKASGDLQVQLVNHHEKTTMNIGPAEYGNIGFDGDWDAAYHLISPKQLATMKPTGQQAPSGSKWYEKHSPSGWVKVLWDEQNQYPRQVESGNSSKTSRKSMVATITPAPASLPWTGLKTYQQKEFSDTLD